jgi:hypothetical protein
VIWAVVNELLIQPREYTCFNITLKKLQEDPRVTVRLGTPVSGYGQESRNRQARQRIPHRVFKDANGVEKIQVLFLCNVRDTGLRCQETHIQENFDKRDQKKHI